MAAGWHHTRDRVTLCVGGEAVGGNGGFNSTMGKAVRWDNRKVPKALQMPPPKQNTLKNAYGISDDDEPDDLILRATREALRRADIR